MSSNIGIEKVEITNIDKNTQVVIKEYQYVYSKTDKNEYKNYFFELISEVKLINCKYEDRIWNIKVRNSTQRIKLDLEAYDLLNEMLKSYTLLLYKQNLTGGSIRTIIKQLRELIILSDGFSIEEIEEFKCEYEVMSHCNKVTLKAHGDKFAAFCEHGDYEKYICFFRGITLPNKQNARKIANYESIIFFDEVLEIYLSNCSNEEKRRYYPILLWWKITKVIPMRSFEFLSIVFDCVYVDKNGYFWLRVPRSKKRAQPGRIGVVNELRINKNTYILICEYQNIIKEKYKAQYLISYKSYFSFFDNSHKAFALKYKNNIEQTEIAQFCNILDSFYDKVVNPAATKYGYTDVQRLRPGDTRHLAFINMKLQGYSRLTIARIGGHTSLQSQMSYYKRENIYAKSKVKVLSNVLLMNKQSSYVVGVLGVLGPVNELVERSKIYYGDALPGWSAIKKGWCTDNEFPYNCFKVRDCEWCNSYILNLKKYPDAVKDMEKLSDYMDRELDVQLKTLNRTFDGMNIQVDSEKYIHKEQENLTTVSKQIHDIMLQKAILDAQIMEVNNRGK